MFADNAFSNNASNARQGHAHRVGQKRPNSLGLYDMHGNVWEWCRDWYHDSLTGGRDPEQVTKVELSRVIRGGCWYEGPWRCRSASRMRDFPSDNNNALGFRVALSAVRQN